MNGRLPSLAIVLGVGVGVGVAVAAGCEPRPPGNVPPRAADSAPVASAPQLTMPDALLVRFRSVTGTGTSRESWEIEVLQMAGEIRVRGLVRAGGSSTPILRAMAPGAYADFWDWLSGFPLDRYQVEEDLSAPQEGWRKSYEIDVVLGPDRRLLSRNQWTRPLVSGEWIARLEDRLHLMALEYANQELASEPVEPEPVPELEEGVRRALEALGDTRETNTPGGSGAD